MDIKFRRCYFFLVCATLVSAASVSCTLAQSEHISLASFTENYVDVSVYLEHTPDGKDVLSATFTPPDGYHLYSKDIPVTGIDGVGRPTLLELTPNSQLKATGDLTESVKSQEPEFEPKELLVYPLGAVTLSLPVKLPSGHGWSEDELQLTYMACSASQCKQPVVAKRVLIPIPSADMFDSQ